MWLYHVRSETILSVQSYVKSDHVPRMFVYRIMHCALGRLHCALGESQCALGESHCGLGDTILLWEDFIALGETHSL